MEDDYNVRLVDMPTTVNGVTICNAYGDKAVLINPRVDNEKQRRAYDHEMNHLENDDLFSDECVGDIEARAHGIA